ncbi:hypothetical protein ACH49O_36220 [Streptomyces coeruleorubidus]|uniref:hypothetical protein n=1 Tax=Streptomyces coeruleorubidus TaxID=116188 RepID=UPI0033D5B496
MRELLRDEAGLTELAPGTRCHGMDGMSGDRRALRLLERACAVIAVLYATLLAFFTNYDALLITYQNGDLTPTIAIFAGARVGWLGLRLMRSPRRPPAGLLSLGVRRWSGGRAVVDDPPHGGGKACHAHSGHRALLGAAAP